jgi:hypothetical protein
MNTLSGLGIGIALLGLEVALVGVFLVLRGARDEARRSLRLRVTYAGMATASLGLCVFVRSRPPEVLPSPQKLIAVAILILAFVRLAAEAAFLRPRGSTYWAVCEDLSDHDPTNRGSYLGDPGRALHHTSTAWPGNTPPGWKFSNPGCARP